MKAKRILCYLFLAMILGACDNSHSTATQQNNGWDCLWVNKNDIQALKMLFAREEELSKLTKQQQVTLAEQQKSLEELTQENEHLRIDLKQKSDLLKIENEKDRRALAVWGDKDWFWAYQCSSWRLTALRFPLCNFSEHEAQLAKKMLDKGYPFDVTKIFLYAPIAIIYMVLLCILFFIAAAFLARYLLKILVSMYFEPCSVLLFRISSRYRRKILSSWENESLAAHEKIETSRLELSNIQNASKNYEEHLCAQRQAISDNVALIDGLEKKINLVKARCIFVIENCINLFLYEADRRQNFLETLQDYLMEPAGSDFEKYTGLVPSELTVSKIENSKVLSQFFSGDEHTGGLPRED